MRAPRAAARERASPARACGRRRPGRAGSRSRTHERTRQGGKLHAPRRPNGTLDRARRPGLAQAREGHVRAEGAALRLDSRSRGRRLSRVGERAASASADPARRKPDPEDARPAPRREDHRAARQRALPPRTPASRAVQLRRTGRPPPSEISPRNLSVRCQLSGRVQDAAGSPGRNRATKSLALRPTRGPAAPRGRPSRPLLPRGTGAAVSSACDRTPRGARPRGRRRRAASS